MCIVRQRDSSADQMFRWAHTTGLKRFVLLRFQSMFLLLVKSTKRHDHGTSRSSISVLGLEQTRHEAPRMPATFSSIKTIASREARNGLFDSERCYKAPRCAKLPLSLSFQPQYQADKVASLPWENYFLSQHQHIPSLPSTTATVVVPYLGYPTLTKPPC
ncbi:hypothetical protein N658DRAFT_128179 [Parathielavia hyrcaniae]|uniref:Uncharacterized protein n=1 Tax=Parathielavia hyrcaniae TaxID=113614 RepID=A0AAN6Q8T4_9PEZI|nr:hypothetical protein N658DRAFT_128179 [Parathielavia hyrcaniae]